MRYLTTSGDPELAAWAPWPDESGVTVLGPAHTRGASDAYVVPEARFQRGASAPETRSAAVANSMRSMSMDEMLRAMAGEIGTAAGIPMSADRALRVATVFACVRVIAEDVAKLPRQLLMREMVKDRQRTVRATGDPRYDILTGAPNDWMTGQELLEYMVGQAALRGASYAELVRQAGPEGPVTEILPLLPGTCRRVQEDDWSVHYEVTGYGEGTRRLGPRHVWCINGPMFGTISGADISGAAREAVALAQALEGSQSRFHANDLRPAGVLTTKASVQPAQRDAMRSAWQAAYGVGGTGGVAILGDDFDFKTINVTAADGQVIENRQFQIEEVCRFFRVHPWAVMRQASTQAYASIEQTALAHIQHTIMPWVTRVEETVRRDVLDRDGKVYLKLNVNALARATITERNNAYATATKVWMTPNEVRVLEDYDELDEPAMDRVQLQAQNTGLSQSQARAPDASSERASGTTSAHQGARKEPGAGARNDPAADAKWASEAASKED